jgi:hypothetical protein
MREIEIGFAENQFMHITITLFLINAFLWFDSYIPKLVFMLIKYYLYQNRSVNSRHVVKKGMK